jgi:LysM repeat protein
MQLRPNRFVHLPAALLAAVALAMVAAPTPAAAQSACGAFHTLQSGETLQDVAARCGVTVPALLAANPGVADDRDLDEGHRLRVPDPSARQPTPLEACGATYTVRTGDTVQEIAMKCGLTVPLLVAANGPLPHPLGLHEGLRVRIPDVPGTVVADPTRYIAVVPADADVPVADPDSADADEAAATAEVELVQLEGVLQAGPACMQVRMDDGAIVAVTGEVASGFQPGDRVVLMGVPATSHDCGELRTLDLRILYRAG